MSFATAPALPSYSPPDNEDEQHRQAAVARAMAAEDEAVVRAALRLGIGPGTAASECVPLQAGKVRAALRQAYQRGKADTKKPRRALGPAGRS